MTKWYNRIGNTIEMCVDNKWVKGIIINGARTGDGIINMEDLTGKKYWCGSSGEGVHFRKCDDSDGDLITNAEQIRQMTDEELAKLFVCWSCDDANYTTLLPIKGVVWGTREEIIDKNIRYLKSETE